jgi:protein O-GlcNAc transferase
MNINDVFQLSLQHYQAGNLQQAEGICRQILALHPSNYAVLSLIGLIYYQLKNYELAIEYIKKALEFGPKGFEDYYNLGRAYQKKRQFIQAMESFQKVVELNPRFADAYNNIGNILQEKGQLDEAMNYYQKTIVLNPRFEGAYNNIGNILISKGQLNNAISYYQKALSYNPYNAEIYYSLGNAFKETGLPDKAMFAYDKSIECNPNNIKAYWARCMTHLRIIYPNQLSILDSRKRYHEDLLKLNDKIHLESKEDIEAADEAVGSHQPFYLAYQGLNDRELQRVYGNLVCRIMSSKYPQFADNSFVPFCKSEETLRIGIVSGWFMSHSNWNIPIKGWIENINKKRFKLYGYYTGSQKDNVTAIARQYFSRFVEDIYCFEDLCKIIRDDHLHVLIYPEIGMDPLTLRLAALKLAPIQCASWGHPDTSGLPTIDYYLSSDLMEPFDADSHYCEQLVRFPNLSIYYEQQDVPSIKAYNNSFGLRPGAILYLCPQSLFKYLPQYDEIYPLIAQEVRDCQFLFICYQTGNYVTEQFQVRLNETFNRYGMKSSDYIVFLPRLNSMEYHAVNALSDIYLDSIGWSGCNTTLEAIACNLPILTMPGELMRGQHTRAILHMMGMTETIAKTLDEYIELAVKLGQDSGWRKYISERIAQHKHLIYRDKSCVNALEDFIEAAVKEKLK